MTPLHATGVRSRTVTRFARRAAGASLVVLLAGCRTPGRGPADVRAEPFAPGVISDGQSYGAAFAPDGRTVYFMRVLGSAEIPAILESTRVRGGWSEPRVLPFSGEHRDIDPFVMPGGRRLLFNSVRPGGVTPADTAGPYTGLDIWEVERGANGAWGAARPLAGPVNTAAPEFYATATRAGTLYFVSRRAGGRGNLDLYRARRTPDGYAEPENLGAPVNSPGVESNVFVDPDERYIIFFAGRAGGYGRADLYISHNRGGRWTEPRNLGPLVNTPATEFCPMVSPDGRTLHFSRLHTEGGRNRYSMYSIPLAAVIR